MENLDLIFTERGHAQSERQPAPQAGDQQACTGDDLMETLSAGLLISLGILIGAAWIKSGLSAMAAAINRLSDRIDEVGHQEEGEEQ